ncbi:MAG: hypothetical protein Q8R57_08015, partial [Bacteroidota bacterium]|nr:hypothetical protein [Bacteroidota bacterium]
NSITKSDLVNAISKIFNLDVKEIGGLFDNEDRILTFQIENIANALYFNQEVSFFIPYDIARKESVLNSLILGKKLFDIINVPILIDDESDDPFQWLLIKDQKLYLIENMEDIEQFELTFSEIKELSLQKALFLLTNKLDNNKTAYLISDSKIWLTCIK